MGPLLISWVSETSEFKGSVAGSPIALKGPSTQLRGICPKPQSLFPIDSSYFRSFLVVQTVSLPRVGVAVHLHTPLWQSRQLMADVLWKPSSPSEGTSYYPSVITLIWWHLGSITV